MADPSSSSFTEVVKQVAQEHYTQASEIGKSRAALGQLQTHLQDLETRINQFVRETQAVKRQICHHDEAATTATHRCEMLQAQIAALYAKNLKLKFDTETWQEGFQMMLLRNETYRENIQTHRGRFGEAESKWPLMVEVANRRATVKDLVAKKEELLSAFDNAKGNVAGSVQDEIVCLESELNVLKEMVSQRENTLQDEWNIHIRLQKEIEVENKRCGAIFKRLRCQVNKLQASQRQGHWNIQKMEHRAAELKKLLGMSD
ncbi:coiled-coil domain-containing protein 122 [Sphaerodactylus townsendi]|nr:coiled-coil domain-containing protein 122 [Sphaerodactylus townsendi]